MQNKLFFAFSLTLYWVKSSPVDRGSLAIGNLDTDITDLKYVGGLEDFFKTDKDTKSTPKTNINAGFRKKKTINQGVKLDFDIKDLKKFLQEAGLKDVGAYDDGALYALAEGITAEGVGVNNGLVLGSEAYPLTSGQPNVGLIAPPPFPNSEEITPESVKAYGCSLLPCLGGTETPVCACNYNTGNVVSFKNNCDVKKHNCRFDTEFKVILDEICPWEFKSRRSNTDIEIDYSDPKYYND